MTTTYTPEQMRQEADFIKTYSSTAAVMIRQGADAVERVKVLEDALLKLSDEIGEWDCDLPSGDGGTVNQLIALLTETKP
jgi:hypothetical protein